MRISLGRLQEIALRKAFAVATACLCLGCSRTPAVTIAPPVVCVLNSVGATHRTAQGGTIWAHVRDRQGHPLQQAQVQLLVALPRGAPDSVLATASADAQGNACFEPITAGEYVLRTRLVGYRGSLMAAAATDRQLVQYTVQLEVSPVSMTRLPAR